MSFPVLSTIDVHQQNEAVKGYQKTTYRGGSVAVTCKSCI